MSTRPRLSSGVLAPALGVSLALALTGCAGAPRIPYTASEAKVAVVPGIPAARLDAGAPMSAFAALMPAGSTRSHPLRYLALSGGGGDGAYGAGVLNGWSAAGTRPSFDLVSGVSTGALTAPFAFLGSAYDPMLKELYTSGVAQGLVRDPNPINLLIGSGLFGDERLRDLVGRYVTPELLAAVAAENARGRRLLVVTTNLDSKRAVVWNMGAIAASGAPQAIDLFRDVLTASASVPGVFQPQLLDVQADGRSFQELHVDGVVMTPVFTVPQSALMGLEKAAGSDRADIYVLMNGRIEPQFSPVQNSTLAIVEQTLETSSQARSNASLVTTYAFARAHHLGFHLAFIDEAAPRVSAAQGFDTTYMRALYDDGYAKAQSGAAWTSGLPATARPDEAKLLVSR